MLSKIQRILMGFFTLLALLMLIDFGLWGKTEVESIRAIRSSLERHHNAGGNAYLAYRITTDQRDFPVSAPFAATLDSGQSISLVVSPVFQEVNAVTIPATGAKEVHSLRIFTGLVLPLALLLVLGLGLRYKARVSTLVGVMEALALANLVYLCL